MLTLKLLSRGLLALSFVSQGYSMEEESNLKRPAESDIGPISKRQCIETQPPEQPMHIIEESLTAERINLISLPKDIITSILKECYGYFNNISLTCKYYLQLTNVLTQSLNPKKSWIFKIYKYCPSVSSFWIGQTIRATNIDMANNNTYISSLLVKGKMTLDTSQNLYPVLSEFFTRFENLTSLDLAGINLLNPSNKSQGTTGRQIFKESFFEKNSFEKLVNLKFLHIEVSIKNSYKFTEASAKEHISKLREQLKKLTNLSILICPGNTLTDEILECLPKLGNLDLSSNVLITNEGIKKMSSLQYLCLGRNASILPQTLQKIPNLIFLDIQFNDHYTKEDIFAIPNLKILFASRSNININRVFDGLKTLEFHPWIDTYKCDFIKYLFEIARNPVADPYETFLLKLEEDKKK